MLVDVATCTTATTVLGQEISMPLLVAPVAFQRVAHPDGEVAMARAALAADTIMCYSTLATSTPPRWRRPGAKRWFQLYVFSDEGVTRELIAQARDDGFSALVLTIDSPVRGHPRARRAHRVHDPARHHGRVARSRRHHTGAGVRHGLAVADVAATSSASPARPACRCSSRAC